MFLNPRSERDTEWHMKLAGKAAHARCHAKGDEVDWPRIQYCMRSSFKIYHDIQWPMHKRKEKRIDFKQLEIRYSRIFSS